jgi:hypothetical protein
MNCGSSLCATKLFVAHFAIPQFAFVERLLGKPLQVFLLISNVFKRHAPNVTHAFGRSLSGHWQTFGWALRGYATRMSCPGTPMGGASSKISAVLTAKFGAK